MVILHTVAPADVGGLEQVVAALAGGQSRTGHAVTVAVLTEPGRADHPFLRLVRDLGAEPHHVSVRPRRYLLERAEIVKLCRCLRPEVVHTHGYRPDVLHAGVASGLGIPTVTTVHGFTGGDLRNRLYEWLQRMAFSRFDAVAAVSRPIAEALIARGLRHDRVHLVPNAGAGVDPLEPAIARRELGVAAGTFHAGWVGRLTREKGLDVFLAALRYLQDLPLAVSIIGDGKERQVLEARARAEGLGDRLLWRGTILGAGRFFAAFDVFVLSSRSEGSPIALLEAMSAGVPIIATRVGGVPDIVSDREALVVPPEDPQALAQAVRSVYREPEAACRRAEAARERLTREFSHDAWLAKYDAIYRGIRRGYSI